MIPKFRALNIKTGFWFDEQELVFCDGKWFQNWRSFEDDFPLNMRDCAVMQSTGMKDKNGVEIFEGDIVLADGMKKIVTFGEQRHEEDFGDLVYYIGFNVYTKMGYSSVIPVEYEVIGNIYANSELLEEQR